MKADEPTVPIVARFLRTAQTAEASPLAVAVGRIVLDFFGGAIAGQSLPEVRAIAAALDALDAGGTTRRQLPPDRQALLWAAASNAVDAEDTHLDSMLHLEGVVCSAVAATTRLVRCDGATVCRAVAAAYDVGIGLAGSSHYERGWHSSATLGAFAATAGASVVLGLNECQTANALSATASFSAGVQGQFGSEMKAAQVGQAASVGVLAATLGLHGVQGRVAALDGPRGWLALHDLPTVSVPFELGKAIESTSFKAFPCGVVTHAAGEAALEIHTSTPAELPDQVVVEVSPFAFDLAGIRHPGSGLASKLSLAHVVAVALIDGELGLDQFSDRRVSASDVVELRNRVRVVARSDLPQFGATVAVSGSVETQVRRDEPLGSASRPVTQEQLVEKFRALTGAGGVDPDLARGLETRCLNPLAEANVEELFSCLVRQR